MDKETIHKITIAINVLIICGVNQANNFEYKHNRVCQYEGGRIFNENYIFFI